MLLKEERQKLKPLVERHLQQIVEQIGSREIGTKENELAEYQLAQDMDTL